MLWHFFNRGQKPLLPKSIIKNNHVIDVFKHVNLGHIQDMAVPNSLLLASKLQTYIVLRISYRIRYRRPPIDYLVAALITSFMLT